MDKIGMYETTKKAARDQAHRPRRVNNNLTIIYFCLDLAVFVVDLVRDTKCVLYAFFAHFLDYAIVSASDLRAVNVHNVKAVALAYGQRVNIAYKCVYSRVIVCEYFGNSAAPKTRSARYAVASDRIANECISGFLIAK